MKRIIAFALVLIIAVSTVGCSKLKEKEGKISIVCTIFPQYDFVKNLTKGMDNVEVKLLLKAGQESHDYDPSSRDIMSIHDADVFVYVGGESDTWIEGVLATVDTKDKLLLALMDMVELCKEEHDHEEDEEGAHHEHAEEYDEHVWTSVANAMVIVDKLAGELAKLEGINKEMLEQNRSVYNDNLSKLDAKFRELVSKSAKKTIVVADRFPFMYMCKEYGIDYHAAFAGCATSVEPSTNMLLELANIVKSENIKYIFKIEMSAGTTAKHIANETGATILTLHSTHNVTNDEIKAGVTYESLMEQNIENLQKALWN